MGRTIGGYLKEYGFNLDFAPVADVNTNPDNPVIGTRAFSSEPQTAADLVGGACAGFADAGIACTLKHFPRPWRYQRGYPRWHRNAEQNAG